jgi:hypothetical protein
MGASSTSARAAERSYCEHGRQQQRKRPPPENKGAQPLSGALLKREQDSRNARLAPCLLKTNQSHSVSYFSLSSTSFPRLLLVVRWLELSTHEIEQ